jgi:hypothetical protein
VVNIGRSEACRVILSCTLTALLLFLVSCLSPLAAQSQAYLTLSPDWLATITTLQRPLEQERAAAKKLGATIVRAQAPVANQHAAPDILGSDWDEAV